MQRAILDLNIIGVRFSTELLNNLLGIVSKDRMDAISTDTHISNIQRIKHYKNRLGIIVNYPTDISPTSYWP